MSKPQESLRTRFMRRFTVNETTQCWGWNGALRLGYGRMWISGDTDMGAHRVGYELFKGPIPEGLHLHHRCNNPRCVNPDHLEAVTPAEHLKLGETFQAKNAAKTHCPQGHAYTPENTYVRPDKARGCRACMRIASNEWKKRHYDKTGEWA